MSNFVLYSIGNYLQVIIFLKKEYGGHIMNCKNCGAKLKDNDTFCGECGAPVENQQNVQQNNYTPNQQNVQYNNYNPNQQNVQYNNYNPNQQNVNADGVSEQEINDGKVMAVLSYLGCLLLIPLIAANKNKFVRFHLGQGLILFIASVIGGFLSFIPYVGTVLYSVVSIVVFVFMILGIVNACQGKMTGLPLIGDIQIFK